MIRRILAFVLILILLAGQCAVATAAEFKTWSKGTVLTDPVSYFGKDKYKLVSAWDDTGADFSWNWVVYSFAPKEGDVRIKDGYAYVKELKKTGYFEVVEETSKEGRWEIRYTGKEKIALSKSGTSPEGKWHVLVYLAGDKDFRVLLVDGLEFHDIENPKNKKASSSNSSAAKKGSTSSSASSKSSSSKSSSSSRKSYSTSSSTTRKKSCSRCGGDGKVTCSRCSGSGGKYVYVSSPNYSGSSRTSSSKWEYCSKCRGGGTQSCGTCGGDGKVEY